MYVVILNPQAGNGKAKKIFQQLQKQNFFREGTYQLFVTEYEGHLEKIAEQIAQLATKGAKIELIIVIGGDGTMNELVNVMPMRLRDIPITYIPGGTGNDLARGIGLTGTPEEIMQRIINKQRKPQRYWLGRYTTVEEGTRYFVNCLGFGFDAVVARRANQSGLRRMLAPLRLQKLIYIFALFREIFAHKPITVTLELDGKQQHFERALFLTVNNHPYFGGGMKINPQANNNGNQLSLIVVDMLPKWKILALFGIVFFGLHVHLKEVHLLDAATIVIKSKKKLPYQVDGEIYYTKQTTITIAEQPIIIKK